MKEFTPRRAAETVKQNEKIKHRLLTPVEDNELFEELFLEMKLSPTNWKSLQL